MVEKRIKTEAVAADNAAGSGEPQTRQSKVLDGSVCLENPFGHTVPTWTNIPRDGDAALALTMKVRGEPDFHARSAENLEFALAYVHVRPVEMTDPKTGGINTVGRFVLIDDEGRSYSFTSAGIGKSLANLIDVYGPGPWMPGIPVKIRAVMAGRKRKDYVIDPIGGMSAGQHSQ